MWIMIDLKFEGRHLQILKWQNIWTKQMRKHEDNKDNNKNKKNGQQMIEKIRIANKNDNR